MGGFGQRTGVPGRTASPWGRRPARVKISPVFLCIVAVAVTGGVATWQGYGNARFATFVFVFAAYFVVLCLHEFGHAYSAHRAGDAGVEARGYLDLNPLRYMNPVLSILLPAIWLIIGALPLPGGAVLVNRAAARSRWQASLISASGPLMNIVFAGLAMAAVGIWASPDVGLVPGVPHEVFWAGVSFFAWIQLAVALLNLIPVPGLDGYGIVEPYLRYETRRALEPIRPYGILLVLLLLAAFPPVRDGFSHLMNSIWSGLALPGDGPGFGQYNFQFWKH
jgi:Zn-dependent protease